MIGNRLFVQILVLFLIGHATNAEYADKTVSPNCTIETQCLDLIRGTKQNVSRLEGCQVFKCFENRFPCGQKYWIMNWGYKYCRRYASQEFINKFTENGKPLVLICNNVMIYFYLNKIMKRKTLIRTLKQVMCFSVNNKLNTKHLTKSI